MSQRVYHVTPCHVPRGTSRKQTSSAAEHVTQVARNNPSPLLLASHAPHGPLLAVLSTYLCGVRQRNGVRNTTFLSGWLRLGADQAKSMTTSPAE